MVGEEGVHVTRGGRGREGGGSDDGGKVERWGGGWGPTPDVRRGDLLYCPLIRRIQCSDHPLDSPQYSHILPLPSLQTEAHYRSVESTEMRQRGESSKVLRERRREGGVQGGELSHCQRLHAMGVTVDGGRGLRVGFAGSGGRGRGAKGGGDAVFEGASDGSVEELEQGRGTREMGEGVDSGGGRGVGALRGEERWEGGGGRGRGRRGEGCGWRRGVPALGCGLVVERGDASRTAGVRGVMRQEESRRDPSAQKDGVEESQGESRRGNHGGTLVVVIPEVVVVMV